MGFYSVGKVFTGRVSMSAKGDEMKNSIERRKHPRYPLSYRVVYSSSDEPSKEIETETFNISLGGAGILARSPVEEGSKIKLKIYGPGNDTDPVEADGVLCWYEEAESYDPWGRAGVHFESVAWTRLKDLIPD
jgi:c-di-GMP-binding flagellar brake protein YcgR